MASQSGGGLYSWSAVRACKVTAAAPSSCTMRAVLRCVFNASLTPIRILTVTGTSGPAPLTAAAMMLATSLGRRGRAEPPEGTG